MEPQDYGTVRPVPTLVAEGELREVATQFIADCKKHLIAQRCQLPYRITMSYYPEQKQPMTRGYAEQWGRGSVITEVKIGIVDYLQTWKDSLKVVAYHELFHAFFNLDHDDTSFGIMNTSGNFIDDKYLLEDFDYFVKKEFNRVKHK